MVASIAQRLKVAAIEESLNATDRPRDYMVDAGSCRDDAGPLALLTELIPRGVPKGLGEPGPAGCVVQIRRAFTVVSSIVAIYSILCIPSQFHRQLTQTLPGGYY